MHNLYFSLTIYGLLEWCQAISPVLVSCVYSQTASLTLDLLYFSGTIHAPCPQAIADGFLPVLTNEMHFPMKIRMTSSFER